MSIHVKNSPRERVRVSHGLARAYTRYYRDPKRTVSSALFGICILQTFEGFDQGDALLKLADLIDPTCEVRSRRNAPVDSDSVYEYGLSCGHTVNDIDGETPTYCPLCGRRIVGEYDPCKGSGILPEGGPEAIALLQEMNSGADVPPREVEDNDEAVESDTPSTEEPDVPAAAAMGEATTGPDLPAAVGEASAEPDTPVAAAVAMGEATTGPDVPAAAAVASEERGTTQEVQTDGRADQQETSTSSARRIASATAAVAEQEHEAPGGGHDDSGQFSPEPESDSAAPAAAITTSGGPAAVASASSSSERASMAPANTAESPAPSDADDVISAAPSADAPSPADDVEGPSHEPRRSSPLRNFISTRKGKSRKRGGGSSSPSQSPSAA